MESISGLHEKELEASRQRAESVLEAKTPRWGTTCPGGCPWWAWEYSICGIYPIRNTGKMESDKEMALSDGPGAGGFGQDCRKGCLLLAAMIPGWLCRELHTRVLH